MLFRLVVYFGVVVVSVLDVGYSLVRGLIVMILEVVPALGRSLVIIMVLGMLVLVARSIMIACMALTCAGHGSSMEYDNGGEKDGGRDEQDDDYLLRDSSPPLPVNPRR